MRANSLFHIAFLFCSISSFNYAADYDLFIHQFTITIDSINTLEKIWEINFSDETTTDLLVSDNKIFISFSNGLVYCFDDKGKEKWVTEIIGNINNNSVHYKDLFLAVTDAGDLYSINANNGEILQVLGTGEDITTDLQLIDLPNPGYVSKGVIFGTANGNVYCYDIFSFELIWKGNLSNKKIASTPLVLRDKIVFIDSKFSLFCVNSKSGALIWNYLNSSTEELPVIGFPFISDNMVITLTAQNEILAIDQLSGKKIWITKPITKKPFTGLSFNQKEVFYFDEKGILVFINVKDGKESFKIDSGKKEISNYIFDSNFNLDIIAFSDNSVYKLSGDKKIEPLIRLDDMVTSIKVLSEKNFLIKTLNGTVTFFEIKS